MKLPSQEYLRECFNYDMDSGVLTWVSRPQHHFSTRRSQAIWNARYAGTAVRAAAHGYLRTSICKRSLYVHRIIWKLVRGEEPDVIDHLNGDGTDNRLSNLRSSTQSANCRNTKRRQSGVSGVYKHSKVEGWYAQVPMNGKVKSKLFRTAEEAVEWRIAVGREHGFTNRHLGVDQ